MQANGVQVPSKNYWRRVREICTKYDVLMIVDEIITGFGRAGHWFVSEHFGIEPDIMTSAKALTAGYMPMGAVITRDEIADAMPFFPTCPYVQRPCGGRRSRQHRHQYQDARKVDA
jgi:putrescine aminotransferase